MKPSEIKRRLFHIFSGFVFITLIYFDLLTPIRMAAVIIAGIVLSLLGKKIRLPLIHWFLEQLDRPSDIKTLPGKGAIFYGCGVFLALSLFQKDIAMAGIAILALGDAVSPLIGRYGALRDPFTSKKKFLEGTFAGALAGAIAASFFVAPLEAVLASAAAMIAEGVDLKLGVNQIDDNIIMPFVACTVIWILRIVV